MYNDNRAQQQAEHIADLAPQDTAAHGTSSGLAKALWLLQHLPKHSISRFVNQSDWIVGQLSGRFDLSDYNNCLKLGFDPIQRCWPEWLEPLGISCSQLPQALPPTRQLCAISDKAGQQLGLSAKIPIIAGTTDSTAAIYASGAKQPGDAVTSLGSTLVTKVISTVPIFSPASGVYSQPFGEHWLVGGGSNSGGNVLRHYFTPEQMQAMSELINPERSSGLDYYPLLTPGERFPVCDPNLQPRLEPHPESDTVFFHGLLEGIARIEKSAYQKLHKLGCPYPKRVYSAGGGAKNAVWTCIRGKILTSQMLLPEQQDAAYGTAVLARDGFLKI